MTNFSDLEEVSLRRGKGSHRHQMYLAATWLGRRMIHAVGSQKETLQLEG